MILGLAVWIGLGEIGVGDSSHAGLAWAQSCSKRGLVGLETSAGMAFCAPRGPVSCPMLLNVVV